jgi:phosphohistidine phosphatase
MKLYMIRHAPAELRHEFALTGQPDELRPITQRGVERMQQVLQFLKKAESHVDVILTSPLTRCVQTAELCKESYSQAQLFETENLCPDHSAHKLYNEIQSYDVDSMVLIGHEPDLGQFLSWVLFRQATDHFPIKKSGVAKVDLYKDGRAYLKWLLRPKLMI